MYKVQYKTGHSCCVPYKIWAHVCIVYYTVSGPHAKGTAASKKAMCVACASNLAYIWGPGWGLTG